MLRDPDVMSAWEHTFSDAQVYQWIDSQLSRYEKDGVGYFAATRKSDGAFVGQMGLMWNKIGESRVLEVGYMLKRGYQGMGYATEGASALMRHAFTAMGAEKLYATIRPANVESIRVAERIGMNAEGGFIKRYNETDMEHIIYSIKRN